MVLPSISFPRLFHRGALPDSPAGTQTFDSHEGCLCSCAHTLEASEAWLGIAKLGGGRLWALKRASGARFRLLDYHRLTKKARGGLLARAKVVGLVVSVQAYRVSWFDDGIDDEMHSLHAERTDAQEEACEAATIEAVAALAATSKLTDYWGARRREQPAQIALLEVEDAAIAAVVDHDFPLLDGLFWDDDFAPEVYSAPRVGLFQRTVSAVKKREV